MSGGLDPLCYTSRIAVWKPAYASSGEQEELCTCQALRCLVSGGLGVLCYTSRISVWEPAYASVQVGGGWYVSGPAVLGVRRTGSAMLHLANSRMGAGVCIMRRARGTLYVSGPAVLGGRRYAFARTNSDYIPMGSGYCLTKWWLKLVPFYRLSLCLSTTCSLIATSP